MDGCLTFRFVSDPSVNRAGWLANVTCGPPPTCRRPTALTVTNITQTNATITWTQPTNPDGSVATAWEIIALPCNAPAPTATTTGFTSITSNPYTFTSLFPGTCYNVYIRAVCNPTDSSLWAGPAIFTTLSAPPPPCLNNDPAGDSCAIATPICNFNGYCGITDGGFTVEQWPELAAAFCGGLDNESVLSFVASSTSLSLDVWVTSSVDNFGIQIMVYSADTCGSGPVTSYACWNPGFVPVGSTNVVANGLTPGNTYYVMIDGWAGDVCNYVIAPGGGPGGSGIVTQVNVLASSTTICLGQSTTLSATGGNNIYNWTPSTGLNVTTGSPVVFTPTTTGTYVITATSTDGNALCPQSTSDFETIIVTGNITATFNAVAPICTNATAPVLPTTSTNGIQGTWSPNVVSNTATAVYTFTPNVGQCSLPTQTVELTVTVNPLPLVDTILPVSSCTNYTLPVLTNGNYFTGSNGTGTPLAAGTVITTNQTIYIYAQSGGTPNCSNQSSFTVTIGTLTADSSANIISCNNYILPSLSSNNNYYSGSLGTGTMYVAGTTISSSQTMYIYAQSGTCTDESIFTITINTINADSPSNVIACNSYVLPVLSANNNYYTQTGGLGTMLAAGTLITTSQTIFVLAQSQTTPICTDENQFSVTINSTPVPDAPANVTSCDSYILPALTVGNYYTGTNGTGTMLNSGFSVTSTQTIYVYAQSATTPNCTAQNSFVVTINNTPVIPIITNVTRCDSYTLPALTVGNYYTGASASGTMLNAGFVVTSSQTIYVYAQTSSSPNCTSERSFVVTITPSPSLAFIADQDVCNSYVLPVLASGNYFTGTNGTGTQLAAGSSIIVSQTIYVYVQSGTTPNCTDEEIFDVTVTKTPDFAIIGNCQGASFTLEAMAVNGSNLAGATYVWKDSSNNIIGGNSSTVVVTSSGTYTCTISISGCSKTVSFIANDTTCTIQKGISPNGDGDNETFDLTTLDVKQLNIYNRYGTKVYNYTNYTNQWGGQSDKGDILPDGTYYYVIEQGNGDSKSGWIYINK